MKERHGDGKQSKNVVKVSLVSADRLPDVE